MMKKKNYNKINPYEKYNINLSSRQGKSFNESPDKYQNTNFTTYNAISTENNITRTQNILSNTCQYHCTPSICPYTHHCPIHNIHYHHIHFPKNCFHSQNNNNILLNELEDLKKECKKFKSELEKAKEENNIGNRYIKYLETKLNQSDSKNVKDNAKEENISSKYHNMLDRGFEVLNSVSNKCENDKGKLKGDVDYYAKKDPDYNELIEAQKQWLDNLPEKYSPSNNMINNPTYSNTYRILNEDRDKNHFKLSNSNNKEPDLNSNTNVKYINEDSDEKDGKMDSNSVKKKISQNNLDKKFYQNQNNNMKPEIGNKFNNMNEQNDIDGKLDKIVKQRQLNNNENVENDINTGENIDYQKEPQKYNINYVNNEEEEPGEEEEQQQEEEEEEKEEEGKVEEGKEEEGKEEEIYVNNEIDNIQNSNDNNVDEQEKNPFFERYLIIDENENPIMVGGERLLGLEIIPVTGEDGKEQLDENGNIMILGPDGQPRTQEDLEPVLLDNDHPLVNEENKPFLGIDGVPYINGYGEPVVGPGELYDNNQQLVIGILGILPKDNMGNPIKVQLEEEEELYQQEEPDENIQPENNSKGKIIKDKPIKQEEFGEKKYIDYSKLRPLIGHNGKPVKDLNNNFVLLDEQNRPVKNTGITLLFDQSGNLVLNSKNDPILVDPDGKPLNLGEKNTDFNFVKDNNNIKDNELFYPPKKTEHKNFIKPQNKNKNNNNIRKNKIIGNERFEKMNRTEGPRDNSRDRKQDSIRNISFLMDKGYKGSCFACDAGCSVSKSGYSPMNFSPYNNLIRRQEVTEIDDIEQEEDMEEEEEIEN